MVVGAAVVVMPFNIVIMRAQVSLVTLLSHISIDVVVVGIR